MKVWIVKDHKHMGDNVEYFGRTGDDTQHRWVGWTTPRPHVGDILITDMKSGAKASFTIIEMELCRDPDDMWFAKTDVIPDEAKLRNLQ